MIATDDFVSEFELLGDVFGADVDCFDIFRDDIERGKIETCAGEWRREPDGRWRFWRNPDFDE